MAGKQVSGEARSRLGGERGFTLVEVLVAMGVLVVGIVSTIGVFTSSKHATLTAQKQRVATRVAHQELERLQEIDYDDLKLSEDNYTEMLCWGNETRPCGRGVASYGGWFDISGQGTPAWELILFPYGGPAGGVQGGPERFEVGGDGDPATSDGGAVTGDIYRYVTYRDETCDPGVCDGVTDTKRITVGVSVDSTPGAPGLFKPVWASTVVIDPDSGGAFTPPNPNPGGDAARKSRLFYLHDNPCQGSYEGVGVPWADHDTTNTAASDPASLGQHSRCWNTSTPNKPDYMTNLFPLNPTPVTDPPPLVDYSADLTGATYPGGLRLTTQGASTNDCDSAPTTYPYAERKNPAGPNKWNTHAWSSRQYMDLTLTGVWSLSLHATTVDGAGEGLASFCATLIHRNEHGPLDDLPPTDVVLGSMRIDQTIGDQPSGFAQFHARGVLPDQNGPDPGVYTIPNAQGHRLVLVLSARGDSQRDVVLAYGNVLYPSHLNVEVANP